MITHVKNLRVMKAMQSRWTLIAIVGWLFGSNKYKLSESFFLVKLSVRSILVNDQSRNVDIL